MKKNPQFVMGHKAPRYLCKVSLSSWRDRLIWWAFRRWLLNEDYYRVVRRFTGPRKRSAHSTLKADAHSYRYYIEQRSRPYQLGAAWRDVVTPITRPITHRPPAGDTLQ